MTASSRLCWRRAHSFFKLANKNPACGSIPRAKQQQKNQMTLNINITLDKLASDYDNGVFANDDEYLAAITRAIVKAREANDNVPADGNPAHIV
jgi:hypothetical protein